MALKRKQVFMHPRFSLHRIREEEGRTKHRLDRSDPSQSTPSPPPPPLVVPPPPTAPVPSSSPTPMQFTPTPVQPPAQPMPSPLKLIPFSLRIVTAERKIDFKFLEKERFEIDECIKFQG